MAPAPDKPIVHVVDDDDSLRKALSRLLTSAGYEVHAYASAGAFALATREKRRGCLVLDLQMPGPSGLDLQEMLAREERAGGREVGLDAAEPRREKALLLEEAAPIRRVVQRSDVVERGRRIFDPRPVPRPGAFARATAPAFDRRSA